MGHRSQPVCPFTPLGVKINSIYFGRLTRTLTPTKEDVEQLAREMKERFLKLEPVSGGKMKYKAIIFVFEGGDNGFTHEEAFAISDHVKRALKPGFVKEGLMCGEFNILDEQKSRYNVDFHAGKCPVPGLGIRYMVPQDISLLNPKDWSVEIRRDMLNSFCTNFETDKNTEEQIQLAKQFLAELNN
jgi:hypothetical protein